MARYYQALQTRNDEMNKFSVLLLLAFFLLTNNLHAQQQYKVGLAVWSGYDTSVQGFKDGMLQAGLIEGENVTYLQGKIGASKELQMEVAKDFRTKKVDLVYSLTTPGTTIMKQVLDKQTPIVFSIVTYPADSGLIESFEYSGNNLVGTSNFIPLRNYITLLKLMQPNTKKVAIFHRKDEPNSNIQAANLIRLLKREKITVVNLEPQSISELIKMANQQVGLVDLFISTTDTLLQSGGEEALIKISLANNIPILSSNKMGIEQGSTFGPTADFYTLGKMSGLKAAKILLEGIKPTKLQSELQETPLYLANKNSIQKLNLTLSEQALKKVTFIDKDK